MHYSTAKWLIGILASIVIATTVFIFYSDHIGVTYPLLEALYKPIILIEGVPALLLIFGLMIGQGRKRKFRLRASVGLLSLLLLFSHFAG